MSTPSTAPESPDPHQRLVRNPGRRAITGNVIISAGKETIFRWPGATDDLDIILRVSADGQHVKSVLLSRGQPLSLGS